jgi:hypothetical protein
MKRWTVITIGILIVLFLVYSAYGYPMLTNDTHCFLPTAFELKYNHSLTNELYDAGFNNGNKFIFYPPGFPFILSQFIWGDFAFNIFLAINFINIISLFCIGFICYKSIRYKPQKWQLVLYIIVCASYLSPSNSRPELLVHLLYYSFIVLEISNSRYKHPGTGILVAITLITSPINGFYLGLITLLCLFYNNEINIKTLWQITISFFITLFTFVAIYPFTISELITTMQQHAKNCITQRTDIYTISAMLKYHIFNPLGTGGIFIISSSLILIIRYLISHKNKYPLLILFAVLVFSMAYFGLKSVFLSYNIYSLSPFALYSIFLFSVKNQNAMTLMLSKFLFLSGSASLFYTFVIFVISLINQPKSIQQVNNELAYILKNENCTVAFSPSFWPLFKSPSTKCDCFIYNGQQNNTDYILLQQYTTGQEKPPHVPGYNIIKNDFDPPVYLLNSIRIMKYKPFYQYALYKKNQ